MSLQWGGLTVGKQEGADGVGEAETGVLVGGWQ
jgi:hypothetical protein